jgi:hypothetical protein
MDKEPSWARKLQKQAMQAAESVVDKTSEVFKDAKGELGKLDRHLDITKTLNEAGAQIASAAKNADSSYGIGEKASAVKYAATDLASKATDIAIQAAEHTGLNKVADKAREAISQHIAQPAAELMQEYHLEEKLKSVGHAVERAYGGIRSTIKPYFPPETPDELLRSTKRELAYISACIMQISAGEAEQVAGQFGAAITSKIAGVATAGALLSLVSTFGTAGTGTAIASLSGAAATNATLAWVGSLLGGGMATGALLTGGLGIVVGLSAYKAISSERRAFESITETEQRIVQYCWMLIAIIDDHLNSKSGSFNAEAARLLLQNTLLPLQVMLVASEETICANLDVKNAVAYRQHVLIDFQRVVIDGFNHFIGETNTMRQVHYEYVIGGVLYALMTRTAVDDSVESQLVLDALRRSDNDLVHASEAQLSDYLDNYDAEQLKGIANNIKGIYHEELWVHQYNATHTGTHAELFGATNNPGADIQIIDSHSGAIIDAVQLKATDSAAYVEEHLQRYPDIKVLVTDETAHQMTGIDSSGISNAEITAETHHDLDALADNALGDRVMESAELSAAIATGRELIEMLQGRKAFPDSVVDTVKRVGAASAATAIAAYLFS